MTDQRTSTSLPHAARKFYDLPENPEKIDQENVKSSGSASISTEQIENEEGNARFKRARYDEESPKTDPLPLFSYIEENVIGKDKVFSGPFGLTKGTQFIQLHNLYRLLLIDDSGDLADFHDKQFPAEVHQFHVEVPRQTGELANKKVCHGCLFSPVILQKYNFVSLLDTCGLDQTKKLMTPQCTFAAVF